jgi:MFS family permease
VVNIRCQRSLFSTHIAFNPNLSVTDWPVDQLKIARLVTFKTAHFTGARPAHPNYIMKATKPEKRMICKSLQWNSKMLKSPQWPRLLGYFLFTGMLSAGYYYNLTFVQLGLEDFGTRWLELSPRRIAADMALFALLTCLAALAGGYWMQHRGWGRRFRLKLRLAFFVVLAQTVLTAVCPLVRSEAAFLAWLSAAAAVLGLGVPALFSMAVDLVPTNHRGLVAGLVTALAYFAAETFSTSWTFEAFRSRVLLLTAGGTLLTGVLAFARHPWLDQLARQHRLPAFGRGRFTGRPSGQRSHLLILIVAMFAIYFVDSLGFLRLLKTPVYMQSAWQSPDINVRLFIAAVHVAGALAAGILYTALSERHLFLWVFGIFALAHLQYSFDIRLGSGPGAALSMPMLYALAVSLYTVLNFALWADLSTPDTICMRSALGVALSGWTATFLSTALAIYLQGAGVSLERHVQIVDALAMLFFTAALTLAFFRGTPARRPEEYT